MAEALPSPAAKATSSFFKRFALLAFFTALSLVACGRAALDGYELGDGGLLDGSVDGSLDAKTDGRDGSGDGGFDADGDADGGLCNAATCPGGCCDARGRCQVGNGLTACGAGGRACEDCLAAGFQLCDAQRRTCARDEVVCNAATCADGCCRAQAPRCLSGESNTACGTGGAGCAVCPAGQVCNAVTHRCEADTTCGPGNCAGCCDPSTGLCRIGQDDVACGAKGETCNDCDGGSCTPLGPLGGFCSPNPVCGPANCPGCCVGNICVPGNQNTACGLFGQACDNCSGAGLVCNANKCQNPPPQCNPTNCPMGCCNGTVCQPGTSGTQCGFGGQACQNCTVANLTCQFQQCQSTCNAATCPNGCCNGNTCVTGSANNQCGTGGAACLNCTSLGLTCQAKKCAPPACNAATCPNGCCSNGTCMTGSSNGACGTGGVACQNCTAQNNVCSAQKACVPVCNATTCPNGCCDSGGVCNTGFSNNKCGSGGATCANCTLSGATCNTLTRACSNQPSTCPAPYGQCPAALTTKPVTRSTSCSAQNLADARTACSAGPNSASCQSYFTVLETVAPACATCLENFHYPFNVGTGLYKCVAPFLQPQCNHATACATDCLTTSCSKCPSAASQTQCENSVRTGNGQCTDEYQASACFANGLQGAGAFCNPATYQGNFGRWLEGVGLNYCAP